MQENNSHNVSLKDIKNSKEYKIGMNIKIILFICQIIFIVFKFIPNTMSYYWSWWLIFSPLIIWLILWFLTLFAYIGIIITQIHKIIKNENNDGKNDKTGIGKEDI
jgi:hypothetical protein